MMHQNLQLSDLRSNAYRSLPGDQDIFSLLFLGAWLELYQLIGSLTVHICDRILENLPFGHIYLVA